MTNIRGPEPSQGYLKIGGHIMGEVGQFEKIGLVASSILIIVLFALWFIEHSQIDHI